MELTKEDMTRLAELIKQRHQFNMGTIREPRMAGQVNVIGSVKKTLVSILPEINELLKEKGLYATS